MLLDVQCDNEICLSRNWNDAQAQNMMSNNHQPPFKLRDKHISTPHWT